MITAHIRPMKERLAFPGLGDFLGGPLQSMGWLTKPWVRKGCSDKTIPTISVHKKKSQN